MFYRTLLKLTQKYNIGIQPEQNQGQILQQFEPFIEQQTDNQNFLKEMNNKQSQGKDEQILNLSTNNSNDTPPLKKNGNTNPYFQQFEQILKIKENESRKFNKILQITKIILKHFISQEFEFPDLKPNFYQDSQNTFLTQQEKNFMQLQDNQKIVCNIMSQFWKKYCSGQRKYKLKKNKNKRRPLYKRTNFTRVGFLQIKKKLIKEVFKDKAAFRRFILAKAQHQYQVKFLESSNFIMSEINSLFEIQEFRNLFEKIMKGQIFILFEEFEFYLKNIQNEILEKNNKYNCLKDTQYYISSTLLKLAQLRIVQQTWFNQ